MRTRKAAERAGRTAAPRGTPRATPRAALIVAVAVFLSLGLAGLATSLQSVSEVQLPDNPLRGRALYESKRCVQCHGLAGSEASIGPILGEGRFDGTFLELGAALWNHVPGMSVTFEVSGLEWPQLSAAQATELVAFLYFIDYLGRPGVAADGRDVFEREGCSACHAIGGGEANVGPDLAELSRFASPLSVAQQIWNHGPSMFESMRRMNVEPPLFEQGELADLSAYIRQRAGPQPRQPLLTTPGNPNRGDELFVSKGCSTCHGRDARGGSGGPNLTRFELRRPAEAIASTMWNHGLAMSDAMTQRGLAWPQFEGSELADLAAFLYFLRFNDPPGDPGRGAEVFVNRSCSACHPLSEGQGGDLPGPVLAGSTAASSSANLVSAMWNHAPLMKEAILRHDLPWPELSGADLRDLQAYLVRLDARSAGDIAAPAPNRR
jgi:mono/diheme cytochrome c family protein